MLTGQRAQEMTGRFVKIIWQLDGAAHLDQGAGGHDILAHHWTAYDAGEPYVMDMSDNSAFLALVFEVGSSDNWKRLIGTVGGRAIKTSGAAQVALGAARSVLQENIRLSARARNALKDSVWSFLSLHVSDEDAESQSSRSSVLRDAKRFVMQNLAAPGLGPDQIAAALNVSRRTIYNAFSEADETPHDFILRSRLERCRDVLAEGGSSQRASITNLAFDLGFNDSGYFSRAFKRHYGLSPSQFMRKSHALTRLS
jgi:AraC-like DNA-binding protein